MGTGASERYRSRACEPNGCARGAHSWASKCTINAAWLAAVLAAGSRYAEKPTCRGTLASGTRSDAAPHDRRSHRHASRRGGRAQTWWCVLRRPRPTGCREGIHAGRLVIFKTFEKNCNALPDPLESQVAPAGVERLVTWCQATGVRGPNRNRAAWPRGWLVAGLGFVARQKSP
jgi:hypothetical protein